MIQEKIDIRSKIVKALQQATGEKEIQLSFPEREEHGDYTTNVAMILTKTENKNPRDYAQELVKKVAEVASLKQFVSKIEVAGPGFINFFLTEEYLIDELQKINEEYGNTQTKNPLKIMFEYGQPNTHKLPHIGHLYSYIYGESMSRLLEAVGNAVQRVNYQGDVGLQVAKCLWAYLKAKPQIPTTLIEKVELLQDMYQKGSKAYDESEENKNQIQEINKKIYAQSKDIVELWQETRGWSVEYYKQFEKRMNIKQVRHYFESEVQAKGKKIVEANLGKVFERSEGAIIFPGENYGLHSRVFVTKQANPTYEAKDLALEILKMGEWPNDLIVITTAHEQNEYFKVVFKAIETLNPEFSGKLKHIGFGMVQLKTGKMSSRTGNIIGGIELVDLTIQKVRELSKGKEDIAEIVGQAAVKYSLLKTNPLQDITFSLEESISTEGNSGPYIQYTYARTQSILKKTESQKEFDNSCEETNYPEELSVAKFLLRFPEIVANAAINYSPNLLCNYLFELSQKFNTFYNKHKVIGSQKEEYRLLLTKAVGIVLKNGLNLLGIEAPERM